MHATTDAIGSIGSRALQQIGRVRPGALHRDLAAEIGMTPDAFSRALNGKRSFSSLELASLADALHADVHWLITGEPDPYRVVIAARHGFDHATGRRDVPGRDGDEQALRDVTLAYRQGDPRPRPAAALPDSAEAARATLGDDFIRPFADRLEERLEVDVVRIADLSTAYSLRLGGRRVIVLPATGNWFWENWSLAHELAHLALGHHDLGLAEADDDPREAAANAFAAELLLPRDALAVVDWDGLDAAGLAALVWRWGVSTDALARRLNALTGYLPDLVRAWAAQPTQRLLRRHWAIDTGIDEITARMDAAAARRFPRALQEQHLERIALGALGKGTLAWMLGIHPEALDVDVPPATEVPTDELVDALGL